MEEKEYIVTLNKDVDIDAFHEEMISTYGNDVIPARAVGVVNLRPLSKRNTHYSLTDEEAQHLRDDERVMAVEIPVKNNPLLKYTPNATDTSTQVGFKRHSNRNFNDASTYSYNLTGKNVDIVIMDTGVDTTHSEFTGRVESVNWDGTNVNHNTDSDGHGTHVAGTALGSTYGWAKDATLISCKIDLGLTEPAIDPELAFDYIRAWHTAKTNGKPTVVNLSWGVLAAIPASEVDTAISLGLASVTYRGTQIVLNSSAEANTYGLFNKNGYYLIPVRIPSLDAELEEMIADGVHAIVASGNESMKIDIPGGLDYNNITTMTTTTYGLITAPYHQGPSPLGPNAISVGSIEFNSANNRSSYSNYGPGVDIYAAGSGILSSIPNNGTLVASGTSFAAPQVAGIAALYLEAHPNWTPTQLRDRMFADATLNLIPTSADNDYTTNTAISNGNNRILFNRYNNPNKLNIVSS